MPPTSQAATRIGAAQAAVALCQAAPDAAEDGSDVDSDAQGVLKWLTHQS